MIVQAYLTFDGRCEEALEFYKKAIGAEVTMVLRFKECPEPGAKERMKPGTENKIMHSEFKVGDTTLMASDGHMTGETKFHGFGLSILVSSEEQADRFFKALSEGGSVTMPLMKTFYSPRFGMVKDKFGLLWMIYLPQK